MARDHGKIWYTSPTSDVLDESKVSQSDDNKKGVLTSKLDEYLACLDLGTASLKKLFTKDEKKWKENLKKT